MQRSAHSCVACLRSRTSQIARARTVHNTSRTLSESGRLKDPNSPFHIPPGTLGPAHENDHSTSRPLPSSTPTRPGASTAHNTSRRPSAGLAPDVQIQWSEPDSDEVLRSEQFRPSAERLHAGREGAERYFDQEGYDSRGRLEWDVAWGDCDMFQHANNVNYVRWLESARIRWSETLANDLPNETVMNMLHGRGMGFILKEISVRYRHPLTYPDTMIIAVRPHSINPSRASFGMAHALWSLKDNKLAATADSTIVMYDYDRKRKGTLSEEFMAVLEDRSGTKRLE